MSSRVLVAKPTQTGKTNEAVVPALTFSDRTAQQLPVQQTQPVSPATFAGNFAGIPVAASPDQRGGYPPLPPAIRPPWPIQAKLEVGAVDDPLEREADRVAEQVMGMPEPAATAKAAGPAFAFQSGSLTASRNDNKVADNPTMSGYTSKVQRECACGGSCEKCKANEPEEEQGQLRRKPAYPQISAANSSPSSTGMEAPPIVHEVLRSPGQPLDAATRAFFEPRFGRDFSGVRLHTNLQATTSTHAINAMAYTVDSHIALGGDFAGNSVEARKALLAHELAHIVQQQGGSVRCQRQVESSHEPKMHMNPAAMALGKHSQPIAEPIESTSTASKSIESCMKRYESTTPDESSELVTDQTTLENKATLNIDSWVPYLIDKSNDFVNEAFASEKEFAWWSTYITKTLLESLDEFPLFKQVMGTLAELAAHHEEKDLERRKTALANELKERLTVNQRTARIEATHLIENALAASRKDPTTPCGKHLKAIEKQIDAKYPHMDETKFKEVEQKIKALNEAVKRKMQYETQLNQCLATDSGTGPGSKASLEERKQQRSEECHELFKDPDRVAPQKNLTGRWR